MHGNDTQGTYSDQSSASRDARLAGRRMRRHERLLHLLQAARRIRLDNGYPVGLLESALQQTSDEFDDLRSKAGGRILPRNRPKVTACTDTCTVYIDECGTHSLAAKDSFKAFCLAAVIVRDSQARSLDRRWKQFKRIHLGSSGKLVHEPDIRHERSSFWCDDNAAKRAGAIRALDGVLRKLPYVAVACVLDRPEYVRQFGNAPLDASFPEHAYLMAVDLLAEQLVVALHKDFKHARGRLVLESRGSREDALVQYEFARLFVDGTPTVPATWFRQQLFPGLDFREKSANSTGLQLADLLDRPCAEKVIAPSTTPDRWLAVRSKLSREEHEWGGVGLRIVPWDAAACAKLWKS